MTKANKDGWIRWKGGLCPVDSGVLVDVRYRDKSTKERLPALEPAPGRMATDWSHTKEDGDIMYYRLHKTEELRPTEPDPRVVEAKQAPKFDPVALRDEVKALRDAITAHQEGIFKITARIEEIEIELDNEGFALVEKPQQKQALPDMDDPANWRVGDKLTLRHAWFDEVHSYIGREVTICSIVEYDSSRTYGDRFGISVSEFLKDWPHHKGYERNFEFHSRP